MYIVLICRYINQENFEPLWNRDYIEQVDIVMKERVDVAGTAIVCLSLNMVSLI